MHRVTISRPVVILHMCHVWRIVESLSWRRRLPLVFNGVGCRLHFLVCLVEFRLWIAQGDVLGDLIVHILTIWKAIIQRLVWSFGEEFLLIISYRNWRSRNFLSFLMNYLWVLVGNYRCFWLGNVLLVGLFLWFV